MKSRFWLETTKLTFLQLMKLSWTKKIKDERVSILGYNLRRDRNRHGGGVAIFLRETLNFEHRTDIKAENLEIICIEIKPKCSKPFFVLAWYRKIIMRLKLSKS